MSNKKLTIAGFILKLGEGEYRIEGFAHRSLKRSHLTRSEKAEGRNAIKQHDFDAAATDSKPSGVVISSGKEAYEGGVSEFLALSYKAGHAASESAHRVSEKFDKHIVPTAIQSHINTLREKGVVPKRQVDWGYARQESLDYVNKVHKKSLKKPLEYCSKIRPFPPIKLVSNNSSGMPSLEAAAAFHGAINLDGALTSTEHEHHLKMKGLVMTVVEDAGAAGIHLNSQVLLDGILAAYAAAG